MPLIPYADTGKLPDDAREAFDRLPRKLNIFRMWANAPDCFRQGLRFGGAILGRQKLPADVPIALAAGCREEQIDALEKAQFDADCFDTREKVLLCFSEDVIRNVAASEANVEAAKKHFSPQEIVEIVLTCGFYMTVARLTETTRVEIDAPGGVAVLKSLQKMR
jgi:hypothetical protein